STGSNDWRSSTYTCTPPTVFPVYLENVGVKYASLNDTPGNFARFSASDNFHPSIYGAPINSNGRVVPRPSDRLVPSINPMPGYTVAVSSVGMLGDGGTQGSPV